jgi:hypothetical protein
VDELGGSGLLFSQVITEGDGVSSRERRHMTYDELAFSGASGVAAELGVCRGLVVIGG